MTATAVVPSTTRRRDDNALSALVDLAVDLTAHLATRDRSQRLIDVVHRVIPCDSAALLRLDGNVLVPIATRGLVPEVSAMRFAVSEHPRFAQILRRRTPIRFSDPTLADPFDGLLASGQPLSRVHACLGAPLVVDDAILGVLAVDALDPHAFDHLDDVLVAGLAALAAAGMRTATLIDALEDKAHRSEAMVRQLAREGDPRGANLIGESSPMRALCSDVELAAHSDLTVLITGETGTGKEVVARAIHRASERADKPLIYVNCAALPETIAESELFGHVRGAFTGALDHRSGKFEIADGGTLFLDEIGELPLSIQAKLLRALQSGEIQRVGADHVAHVDVRVLAATNRNLPAEVAAGRFRVDLFHRLSVYPLAVPPLRERGDDVPLLAGYFLDEARIRLGLGPVRLASDARAALVAYDWPGNVRELEHSILRAALRASGGRRREMVVITAATLDLPVPVVERRPAVVASSPHDTDDERGLEEAVDALKRRRIVRAVEDAHGNWAEAARRLKLDRGNLHRMAKRLGLHG